MTNSAIAKAISLIEKLVDARLFILMGCLPGLWSCAVPRISPMVFQICFEWLPQICSADKVVIIPVFRGFHVCSSSDELLDGSDPMDGLYEIISPAHPFPGAYTSQQEDVLQDALAVFCRFFSE